MLPFKVEFRPGEPPYREIAFAATRAIVSGVLTPGSPFPSVREMSQELKVNPNTAHKVVGELTGTGLLEVRPGIGTVVADLPPPSARDRKALLSRSIEELVVEAARLGLNHEELRDAVSQRWHDLLGSESPPPDASPLTSAHAEPEPERR